MMDNGSLLFLCKMGILPLPDVCSAPAGAPRSIDADL
jgi:hypothetical protein